MVPASFSLYLRGSLGGIQWIVRNHQHHYVKVNEPLSIADIIIVGDQNNYHFLCKMRVFQIHFRYIWIFWDMHSKRMISFPPLLLKVRGRKRFSNVFGAWKMIHDYSYFVENVMRKMEWAVIVNLDAASAALVLFYDFYRFCMRADYEPLPSSSGLEKRKLSIRRSGDGGRLPPRSVGILAQVTDTFTVQNTTVYPLLVGWKIRHGRSELLTAVASALLKSGQKALLFFNGEKSELKQIQKGDSILFWVARQTNILEHWS